MILVCGGAGYIGSHCTLELLKKGYDVVVLDNLSTGYREAVDGRAKFFEGSLHDSDMLSKIFTNHNIEGVIHFAANSLVAESMEKPMKYYHNNVSGTINLLQNMIEHDINKIVFSSTASVYGNAKKGELSEDLGTNPTNVYGQTKLVIEGLLRSLNDSNGLKSVVFRYFNVAGADKEGLIGESHNPETHLIPIILQVALGKRKSLDLYGSDYDTPDGTCVRDYIHVTDLCQAHILAMDYLLKGGESNLFNLGNGKGFSNLEIIEASRRVTGNEIPVKICGRRAGDPDALIADYSKAKTLLSWEPQYKNVEDIIDTAWRWHSNRPQGYRG